MKLSFFDKENEIVLNIPKKILNDNDKINLLPEFLKEIQDKMNHLSEENKKMKIKKTKVYNNRIKEIKNNYRANNTFSLDINKEDFTEKKLDKTTIANGNNLTEINYILNTPNFVRSIKVFKHKSNNIIAKKI